MVKMTKDETLVSLFDDLKAAQHEISRLKEELAEANERLHKWQHGYNSATKAGDMNTIEGLKAELEEYKAKELGFITSLYNLTENLRAAKAELETVRSEVEERSRIINEIWDELYGQGFEVLGWHLNGDTEPLDTWFEHNDWSIESANPVQDEEEG